MGFTLLVCFRIPSENKKRAKGDMEIGTLYNQILVILCVVMTPTIPNAKKKLFYTSELLHTPPLGKSS